MQEPSDLDKIVLVSIWFRKVLTQIITQVYKNTLAFRYPSIMKHLIGITILILTSRFVDTIIDVDY